MMNGINPNNNKTNSKANGENNNNNQNKGTRSNNDDRKENEIDDDIDITTDDRRYNNQKFGDLSIGTYKWMTRKITSQLIQKISLYQIALMTITERCGQVTMNEIKSSRFINETDTLRVVNQHLVSSITADYADYTECEKEIIKSNNENIYTIILIYAYMIQHIGIVAVKEVQWNQELVSIALKYCMCKPIINAVQPPLGLEVVGCMINGYNQLTKKIGLRRLEIEQGVQYLEVWRINNEARIHKSYQVSKESRERRQNIRQNGNITTILKTHAIIEQVKEHMAINKMTIEDLKTFEKIETNGNNNPSIHQCIRITNAFTHIQEIKEKMAKKEK